MSYYYTTKRRRVRRVPATVKKVDTTDFPLKETGQPTITRIGTRLHPTVPVQFNAQLRSRDNKKFNVRVMALNEGGAVKQIEKLFPGANIHKIGKARIATIRRVGKRITATAERLEKLLGK